MHPFRRRFAMSLALTAAVAATAAAQDNYEIQVYGAPTMEPHSTMFELHSNFTINGRRNFLDGMYPTNHAEHETLEITQGLNDWSEVGFYVFTSERSGQGVQWVGDHIRPRVRVPESWGWPVGVSLSTEVGYQRSEFSEDTWNWEIRPIIDQTIGAWYWAINPALERTLVGPGTVNGVEFSPNVKVSYNINPKVAGGVEYYGGFGSLNGFDPPSEQQHQFFGAVDLNVSPIWEINFGLGWGTTPSTEHLIAKLILGRHVFWGNQEKK